MSHSRAANIQRSRRKMRTFHSTQRRNVNFVLIESVTMFSCGVPTPLFCLIPSTVNPPPDLTREKRLTKTLTKLANILSEKRAEAFDRPWKINGKASDCHISRTGQARRLFSAVRPPPRSQPSNRADTEQGRHIG